MYWDRTLRLRPSVASAIEAAAERRSSESDERERTVKIGGSSKQQQKRKAIRARSRCWNPKLPLCFNIKSLKKKNMQS